MDAQQQDDDDMVIRPLQPCAVYLDVLRAHRQQLEKLDRRGALEQDPVLVIYRPIETSLKNTIEIFSVGWVNHPQ